MADRWQPHPHHTGVLFRRAESVAACPTDIEHYRGDADALVAAGIVSSDHLPGAPGMNRLVVRVLPNGTPLTGRSHCGDDLRASNEVGAMRITAIGGGRFDVTVRVSARPCQGPALRPLPALRLAACEPASVVGAVPPLRLVRSTARPALQLVPCPA